MTVNPAIAPAKAANPLKWRPGHLMGRQAYGFELVLPEPVEEPEVVAVG
jgi:hypothetical protein